MDVVIRQRSGAILSCSAAPLYAAPATVVGDFCRPIGNTPGLVVVSIGYDFRANRLGVVVESPYETNRRLGVVR